MGWNILGKDSKKNYWPGKFLKVALATVVVSLLGCILPSQLKATLVIRMSLLELTVNSGIVFEGEVISLRYVQPVQSLLCTEVTMRVIEMLRGEARDTVKFIIPGGTTNGVLYNKIIGSPRFSVGETAVVFLEGQKAEVVTAMSQGKFAVETVGDKCFAVQNTKGLCLVDAEGPLLHQQGGSIVDWESRFSTSSISKTSKLEAGATFADGCGTAGCRVIHGDRISVPLKVFKDTVRECNPDNYEVSE